MMQLQGKKELNMTIWRQLETFLNNSLRDAPIITVLANM